MYKLIPVASSAWFSNTRQPCLRYRSLSLGIVEAIAFTVILIIGLSSLSQGATPRPCDIYENAGTPCVAAHSTTRALFAAYNGRLYQVRRSSDERMQDIRVLATGDYADAAEQDSFCANTSCIITRIFDQSPRHNDLTIEGPGGNGAGDVGAPADALPVTAGGHQVYGISISARMGYRNDKTSGIAVNGQAEGMYMVTSGTHVNDQCCFDYGNAEVSNRDTGNGHMDAINFSTQCWSFFGFGGCRGAGPWVQADLENGLFQSSIGFSQNPSNTGTGAPFVTALLKNNGQDFFALKVANAQTGILTTEYSGSLPTINDGGYAPMHQEGAIVLGTGGDNSNGSIGSFFEGAMTAGLPTDAADDAVQANIVSVGYGGPTGNTGTLTPASEISLRATTACCTNDYLRHQFFAGVISPISAGSSTLDKEDATWIVRRGFGSNSCLSLESKNYPGYYLRHFNFKLFLQPYDGNPQFAVDSTFCKVVPGMNGQGVSLQSFIFRDKFIRHFFFLGFIASEDGSNPWDANAFFRDDVSWIVSPPWAP
jgi:non-reducing end alpha-L-arabinofuranosidase